VLLLIDNFDSFSHLLADCFRQAGAPIKIVRNNVALEELVKEEFTGLVISPGPGTPKSAGNLMEVLDYCHDKLPILGICLGHQAIGEYFGANLVKSQKPVHGKISEVLRVGQHPTLQGLPDAFFVTRYHSLELKDLPEELETILATRQGEIMALSHKVFPIVGIQYHPEAHLTENGLEIIRSWLEVYIHGPKQALLEGGKDPALRTLR